MRTRRQGYKGSIGNRVVIENGGPIGRIGTGIAEMDSRVVTVLTIEFEDKHSKKFVVGNGGNSQKDKRKVQ